MSSGQLWLRCSSIWYVLALVYDYLLSINNEYFVKLTYIPLEDLCQNILKEKKIKLES